MNSFNNPYLNNQFQSAYVNPFAQQPQQPQIQQLPNQHQLQQQAPSSLTKEQIESLINTKVEEYFKSNITTISNNLGKNLEPILANLDKTLQQSNTNQSNQNNTVAQRLLTSFGESMTEEDQLLISKEMDSFLNFLGKQEAKDIIGLLVEEYKASNV